MESRFMERRDFIKKSGSSALYAAFAASILPSLLMSGSNDKEEIAKAMPELFDKFMQYDAVGLSELIKNKQITSAELLNIFIERIEYFNPKINAVSIKLYDRARESILKTDTNSVFAGVPILIKDIVDIGGVVRSDGSKFMQNNIPKDSVNYIKAVEESGLTILGRTNIPEMACMMNTWNDLYGKTLNPWDITKTVFGSSGGSAAAVAVGMVPMAHGTDGAGSNRVPANACGVLGYKPTRGRPASGEKGGSDSFLKANGAISRTVRDNEQLFMSTQRKVDNLFPIMKTTVKNTPLKPQKIAYLRTGLKGYGIDPDIIAEQDEIARLLTSLGHQVQVVDLPVDGAKYFKEFNAFFLTKFVPLVEGIIANNSAYTKIEDIKELTNYLKTEAIFGKTVSEADHKKAIDYIQNDIPLVFKAMFEEYDVLFSAVCPIKTQSVDFLSPMDTYTDKGHFVDETLSLTSFANVCGHPAMSVPLSELDNLPLGSMFQAANGKDELLYQLAYQLEEARPWKDKRPLMSYK